MPSITLRWGESGITAISRGDYLEVEVKDQGIGIEAEEISKIFDKFYSGQEPKTRQVIGTGLGLALVKGLIEAHRGSVEVDSEVGRAPTFRVKLPTAGAAKVRMPRSDVNRQILVVDDEAVVRTGIAQVLSQQDLAVATAADATQALAQLAHQPLPSSFWTSSCRTWTGCSSETPPSGFSQTPKSS